MTPEQVHTFRDVVIQACYHYIDNGGRIIDKIFSSELNPTACCPVAALLGATGGGISIEDRISSLVGFPVSYGEVWSFIHSFDGRDDAKQRVRGEFSYPMSEVGKELRSVFIDKTRVLPEEE